MRFAPSSVSFKPDGVAQRRVHVEAEPGDDLDRRGFRSLDVIIEPSRKIPALVGAWIVSPGEQVADLHARSGIIQGVPDWDPIVVAQLALSRFIDRS
jgi:hypothetical protein